MSANVGATERKAERMREGEKRIESRACVYIYTWRFVSLKPGLR